MRSVWLVVGLLVLAVPGFAQTSASTEASTQQPKIEIVTRRGDFSWVVETASDGSRKGAWVNSQMPLDRIDRNTLKPLPALPSAPEESANAANVNERVSRIDPAVAANQRPERGLTTQPAPSVHSVALAQTAQPQHEAPAPPMQSGRAPKLKEIKIQGYVTDVKSPTEFEIEDYRITRDQGFVLDFENASPEISFKPEDIHVGVELEIRGLLNESTGELKAKSIRVDLEQFKPTKQTAIIATPIQGLEKSGSGWSGRFAADGQAIVITPTTQVLFKPTNHEKKLIKQQQKKGSDAEAKADEDGFEPLTSLDQVDIGMALTYEGTRTQDGTAILATRIEFSRNDLEDGEARLWKSLKASVKGAESLSGGELKINQIGKFKLLPDPTVQEYVAAIGRKLVPPYESRLGATDPAKIPFQFYVVRNDEPNAFALPNGIVVVNSGLIELLDNEAQFAEVIGHEMAHATHEHTWRQQNYKKKTRIGIALAGAVANAYGMRSLGDIANLVNAALVSGYSRTLENQADRVGLEYMTAAGYDPREAPAVWKLMAKKYGLEATDFFYSSHDNHAVRRSYLMNELKNNYRGVDFSALRTNAEEFAKIKAAVVAAKNPKRRLKVS